jgi:hypothetical protein
MTREIGAAQLAVGAISSMSHLVEFALVRLSNPALKVFAFAGPAPPSSRI